MKKQTGDENEKQGKVPHIIGNVIGIALIVLLLPLLIVNTTLIIKSYTKPTEVPNFMGVCPLIVESGSMNKNGKDGPIYVNDLILTKKVDPDTLKVGDIIAFQPAPEKKVVTHRIVALNENNGIVTFTTKGDANNAEDQDPVTKPQVVGLYFQRFPGIGKVAEFLQQPVGMVLCVAVPLALFLLYDILRRFLYNRKNKQEKDSDKEELERLRALAASLEKGEALPAAQPEAPAQIAEEAVFVPIEKEPEAPAAEAAPSAYPPVEGEDFADNDEV